MSTGTPSRVARTSISTPSTPDAIAASMPTIVFSGHRPIVVRCAISRGATKPVVRVVMIPPLRAYIHGVGAAVVLV